MRREQRFVAGRQGRGRQGRNSLGRTPATATGRAWTATGNVDFGTKAVVCGDEDGYILDTRGGEGEEDARRKLREV